jgi:hypothetical protein
MYRRPKPKPFFPGGIEQVITSLFLIALGVGFCLIPLFFGWHVPTKYGATGPGGAGALIFGLIFLMLGLLGLAVSFFKLIIKIFK